MYNYIPKTSKDECVSARGSNRKRDAKCSV